MAECIVCTETLRGKEIKCHQCNSYQGQCEVCGELIAPNVTRCKNCSEYQNRKYRYTSYVFLALAGIAGLLPLWSATVPPAIDYFRDSETSIMFLNATHDRIYVSAVNTGPKPAVLLRYTLTFRGLPVESPVELRLHYPVDGGKESNLVPARQAVVIALRTDGMRSKVPDETLYEQLDALRDDEVTLEVCVQESSNVAGRTCQRRPANFHVRDIDAFLRASAHYEGGSR